MMSRDDHQQGPRSGKGRRAPRDGASAASDVPPALRRAGVGPDDGRPQGTDAAFAVNRLTALAHELANLLDGSMRCLRRARQSLDSRPTVAPGTPLNPSTLATPPTPHSEDAADTGIVRRLDTVYHAMEQMAGIVRSTMSGLSAGAYVGSRRGLIEDWSLADAIAHAADVMRPIADEHAIEIVVAIDDRLGEVAAGSVYAAITAGLRNAIEAVRSAERRDAAAGHAHGGRIGIDARLHGTVSATTKGWVQIDITDDGVGPPQLDEGGGRPMQHGFSTKGPGRGVGLAMARDIVEELGGTIELRPRRAEGPDGAAQAEAGAVLRICYPVPRKRGL